MARATDPYDARLFQVVKGREAWEAGNVALSVGGAARR